MTVHPASAHSPSHGLGSAKQGEPRPRTRRPETPGSASRRAAILNTARSVGVLTVIGFAVYYLAINWEVFWSTLAGITWQSSTLSLLVLSVAVAATAYGWQAMVDDIGTPIGYRRGAQIFLVGQLGKYVPGAVWLYLLQMELGKKAGLARTRIFTASLVHKCVGLAIAVVVGTILLAALLVDAFPGARWFLLLLPVGLLVMHPGILTRMTSLVLRVLRRPGLDRRLRMATIGRLVFAALATKLLPGLHLWLLADSMGVSGISGLLLCTAAMALGMAAGAVTPFVPAGAGTREGVIIAVLVIAGLSAPQAAALAAASRVMFILADLLTAGGAALAARTAPRANQLSSETSAGMPSEHR